MIIQINRALLQQKGTRYISHQGDTLDPLCHLTNIICHSSRHLVSDPIFTRSNGTARGSKVLYSHIAAYAEVHYICLSVRLRGARIVAKGLQE